MKKVVKILLIVLAVVLLIVGGYVGYVFIDYHRVDDNSQCAIEEGSDSVAQTATEYSIMSYNVGFGAYTPDFGFFMDGGKESRAASKESVTADIGSVAELVRQISPDFLMLEELDVDATRSYHVNQPEIVKAALSDMALDSTFAVNYDSPYLFYPILKPHGKTLAGIMTMSRFNMESSLRRSLPIEGGFMKLLDLDRCYDKVRISVEGGKVLTLYTLHLSAYTSDGKVVEDQLNMLLSDMQQEYQSGAYIIAGGDFNKDLLGNSGEIFGIDGSDYTWAQPFPVDKLEGTPFTLQAPMYAVDSDTPVPTCRNADGPWTESQFVITIDGFITSDNVDVLSTNVAQQGFLYSDHNPIIMKFMLK